MAAWLVSNPNLRCKKFQIISLPAGAMDPKRKALVLSGRTLVTKTLQEFERDVPVLEYSVIDTSGVTSDDVTMAEIISLAWTRFRLKSEGRADHGYGTDAVVILDVFAQLSIDNMFDFAFHTVITEAREGTANFYAVHGGHHQTSGPVRAEYSIAL
jgi:hypothetical protein